MEANENPRRNKNNSAETNRERSDIKDSPRDNDRLRKEESTIDLPEVKDIPGQEHIHVLPLGELADTTISSDDEEGVGILDDLNDEDETGIRMGMESDLGATERTMLESGDNFRDTYDEDRLRRASLDTTDFEGEPLNEAGFGQEQTGSDLDVPNSEADDANEKIGEEDEENNSYSLGGDNNDQVVESNP
ncbi:MAG: hypothetical protein H7122_03495 [Chitinophagaceae bacterium]|nr:hypothetical protein [Chitinophagaceae bacterium]